MPPCLPVPNKLAIWAEHVERDHRSLACHPGGSCCLSSPSCRPRASRLKGARRGRCCCLVASRGAEEGCMGAIQDACEGPIAMAQAAQLAGKPTARQAEGA